MMNMKWYGGQQSGSLQYAKIVTAIFAIVWMVGVGVGVGKGCDAILIPT